MPVCQVVCTGNIICLWLVFGERSDRLGKPVCGVEFESGGGGGGGGRQLIN